MKTKRMTGTRLVKYVRRVLKYDENTGVFTWKLANSQVKRGQRAGAKNNEGYINIRLRKHTYPAHRLAWCHYYGEEPTGFVIDHINGDRTDNRIKNLRKATIKENAQNIAKQNRKTGSRYKGVARRTNGKWMAYIEEDGKRDYLGTFATEAEAAMARVEEEKKRGFLQGQDHNIKTLLEEIL